MRWARPWLQANSHYNSPSHPCPLQSGPPLWPYRPHVALSCLSRALRIPKPTLHKSSIALCGSCHALNHGKKNRDRERETSIVRKKGVGFLKGRWHSHSTAQEGSQSFRSSAPACWAPWTAIVVNLTSSQRRPNCLSIKLRQQIHNTMFLEINTTWNHNLYCLLSQYTHSWLFIVHVIAQKENVCLCSLLSGCNPFLCLQTGWCHLSLLFLRPIWCLLSTIQSIPYGQDQVFNWWKLSCFSWPCIQSLLANTESHAKHIFSSVQTSMCFLRLVYAS